MQQKNITSTKKSFYEIEMLTANYVGLVESILTRSKNKGPQKYLNGSVILSSFYIAFVSICEFLYSKFSHEIFVFPVNIFFLRDILIAIVVPPLYLFFLDQLREMPMKVQLDIKLELTDQMEIFQNFYKKLFNKNKEFIAGSICATFYGTVIGLYLFFGRYSLHFFIFRLIGIPGAFLAGAVVYEGIIILVFFIKDIRKIKLNLSSLFTGLKPVTSIGSTALFLWNLVVVIMSVPMLSLGYNNISLTWYFGFYGTLYLIGLLIFILIVFGFHLKMVELKSELLKPLVIALNKSQTKKLQNQTILITNQEIELINQIQIIDSAKEWPIDFASIRDIFFTYTIPIILSLFGISF